MNILLFYKVFLGHNSVVINARFIEKEVTKIADI
jgi:hypothetical protein